MRIGRALTLGLMLAAAVPAAAATTDYTSFHVLGDSLSDAGNVYRLSFGRIPESPPYWRGRFSNGPVWADRVVKAFREDGLPTGNHAWGGSNVAPDGLDVPDLAQQAARYRSLDEDRRGDRPLVAIWSGGNDVLDAGGGGARKFGRRIAGRVGDVATGLYASGTRDFLFLNLPDIGAIPKFADDPSDSRAATRASRAFNRALDDQIADLRDLGANVRKVNVYGLFKDMLENPRDYGVRNMTTPCLDDNDNACTKKQGKRRAFFDEIHPNKVVHKRIAEAVLGKIDGSGSGTAVASAALPASSSGSASAAPVPLPPAAGLMLAGLAGLGWLRLRRRGAGRAAA